MLRSSINPATYNPRVIDDESRRALKRSLKTFGVLGGIIVNVRTGNTIVGGHQKVAILDEINKYPNSDYSLRVELIDVDEKTEKTLNVVLNNPNVSGQWDYDKLRELIPDIDYKDAGLTDADLSMIGVDFLYQTEGENAISDALSDIASPLVDEMARQREERKAARMTEEEVVSDASEPSYDDKREHMKQVKQQVRERAAETVQNMEAYLVLSFSDWNAKAAFCERFGINPYDKFFKGEQFDEMLEWAE